jgi:hypothetical protein
MGDQNSTMRIILVLCLALLLLGCSRRSAGETKGFRPGASQEEVLDQISKLKGRIVQQTSNAILAEVSPPDVAGPVLVHLSFDGGVLDRVYYPPRSQ